jgi:hypothetical protein
MTEQITLFGESTPVLKMCSMCGFRKPVEEFSPQRGGELGCAHYCRKHANEKNKEWRQGVKARREAGELPQVSVPEKMCPKCGKTKPSSEFHKNSNTVSGIDCWCKSCFSEAQTTRRAGKDIDEVHERDRRNRYRAKFSIEIDDLWKRQMGLCDACHLPMIPGGRGRFTVEVDHDHACCGGYKSCGNCVRGLLHSSCNNALGRMDDSVVSLLRLAKYAIRKSGMSNEAIQEIVLLA